MGEGDVSPTGAGKEETAARGEEVPLVETKHPSCKVGKIVSKSATTYSTCTPSKNN